MRDVPTSSPDSAPRTPHSAFVVRWTIGNTSHHGCDALRRDFVGRNARCRKAAGPAAIDFIREHWLRPKPEIEKRIFG